MTVQEVLTVIVAVCCAWSIFCAFIAVIISVNSARLSRIDEPFKDPAQISKERKNHDA